MNILVTIKINLLCYEELVWFDKFNLPNIIATYITYNLESNIYEYMKCRNYNLILNYIEYNNKTHSFDYYK
jgi:hypothetical protein